jgi:Icc-related predicted phosphoesterase
MRIVHGSDWHWVFREVPEADLYIFTGDMMDNYPTREKPLDRLRIDGSYGWRISPENERIRQSEAIKHFVRDGGFRGILGSPDAPILCVRGNHDFVDLAALFEGCNLVHEFVDNEVIEILGKRVSGHRGIPYIYGSWSDEVQRPDLMDRVRAIPDGIDMLLTHYPPALVLDMEVSSNGRVDAYGLEGMSNSVFNKLNSGGLHCFGHIHGSGGRIEKINDPEFSMTFSNAATTFNVIDV